MPKKSKLLGLAAIIPTYSNVSITGDYNFNVNLPIYKDITILDTIISNCRNFSVNSIILVCRPEQLFYLKYKYGDALLFHKNGVLHKTITMFYITVSSRYFNKYDTVSFNLIYAAHIFNAAVLDAFGVNYSDYFLLIDPRHIFDPTIYPGIFSAIRNYLYTHTGDMVFAHSGVNLPNLSYCFVNINTINYMWKNIIQYIREKKPSSKEFAEITFSNLYLSIKEPERVFELIFNTFNLNTWEDYVKLVYFIQSSEENKRESLYKRCTFSKVELNFRKSSKNIIIDTPFSQKVINFNTSSKNWWKKRREIRKNANNK